MKNLRNLICLVILMTPLIGIAQGNLHVKGKIKSDSLVNPGFRLIMADTSGTLDTLGLGQPGEVLYSNGPSQKPTWVDANIDFDPDWPDGTNSLVAVREYVSVSNPYTVPPSKNFHLVSFATEVGGFLYTNGILFNWTNLFGSVFEAGTILSTDVVGADTAWITGYLADPVVVPVLTDLTNNPYTVPAGALLYITHIHSSGPYTTATRVFMNGNKTATPQHNWSSAYLLANDGDVLSTNATNSQVSILMCGFLKY